MSEDNFVPDESNWIELPKEGRLNTEFIKDLIKEVSYTNELFFRPTLRQIVEIGKIKENEKYKSNGFLEVKPERFITLCEKYFVPGIRKFKFDNSNGQITDIVFKKKSISAQLSKIVLASEIFENSLPIIERIFTVPTPIIYEHPDVDGKILTFPKKGYDRRFNSWLPEDSPEIIDDKITMEMAKETIELIVNEFCFKNGEDKTNAIAAIITPFLKGLYPSFNCRMPLFVYMANRERAGKDYLAGITGLIYEGKSIEENPINSEDGKGNSKSNEEELRKKITSAILSGKKRFHSANNKGYINNAVFEAVLTNKYYTDRILGSNKETTHDNEIEFSLSGNMGISFTAD